MQAAYLQKMDFLTAQLHQFRLPVPFGIAKTVFYEGLNFLFAFLRGVWVKSPRDALVRLT